MEASLVALIFTALIAAGILFLIHIHLLTQRPSKALAMWAVAWGFYMARFAFAMAMTMVPSAVFLELSHETATIISALFLVLGTNADTGRHSSSNRYWFLISGGVWVWAIVATLLSTSRLLLLMPVFAFMAIANFAIAVTYITSVDFNRPVRRLVGFIFILWGIHKLDYPLLVGIPDAAVWGYALGSAFTMAAGVGLLTLYLNQERDRADRISHRFKSLAASMDGAVFALDRQARHTEVYGRWFEEVEGGGQAFLGKTAVDVFGEAIASRYVQWALECLEKNEPVTYEWTIPSKDGVDRYFQTTLSPIAPAPASDTDSAIVGVARDITELKRTQFALERRLKEKDVLVQEVHHRVKNNLQVIISMLRLRRQAAQSDFEIAVTNELTSRIMAMALVHESIYQAENLDVVVFSNYLNKLSSEIVRFANGGTPFVSSTVTGDKTEVRVDTAVPLGMIATELIANSVKHAVRPNTPLEIRVDFRAIESGAVLSISDNGPGMGESVSPGTEKSVGLGLVEALCEQIDAELRITDGVGVETKVFISESSIES